ncbi:hypothetical protein Ahy_B09g096623 isoform F [Arachis hypogaea]|uniref:Uncharacterized protein n=1 Tax=Arachis hypogaea TaxID=3818 RepID=A0A444XLI4_ARAHY|nr:hypothetical protein Ahy_B09g096623 isoform F [Arachis hypogaea]
MRSVPQRV